MENGEQSIIKKVIAELIIAAIPTLIGYTLCVKVSALLGIIIAVGLTNVLSHIVCRRIY